MVEEHQGYYCNGKEIPSVTTVLKLLNKPELVDWANWMGKIGKDTKQFTEDAALVGTYVHWIIERSCKKKMIPFSIIKQDERINLNKERKIIKCVNSFKKWKNDYKPKFKYNELRVQNEKTGGTIDCICKINDDYYIIDFKTSKKPYASYFIQLAAYNYLLKETGFKHKISKVAVLNLSKSKVQYTFTIADIQIIEKYYEPLFLKILDTYNDYKFVLEAHWHSTI